MSASTLTSASASRRQGLVMKGTLAVLPSAETPEQDLLAGLLTSAQGSEQASALLQHFPSIGHVIAAEAAQLRAFGLTGRDIAAFRLVREIACRIARSEVRRRPVLTNWQALIAYLQTAMAGEQIEQFRILSRYQEQSHRRRGAAAGHRQSHACLPARGHQTSVNSQRLRFDRCP